MAKALSTRIALGNIQDLSTPTATQQYKLGTIVKVLDDSKTAESEYMYVKAHTGLTAYQPYVLNYSSTSGAEFRTAAPATLTAPGSLVVVPQVAFTANYYGFVLIKGDGKVLMSAQTYAVGDFLQILNAGTTLVVDGTTGSPVRLINSCAICKEAGTTATARNVFLFGISAVVSPT